jgi:hypothetical protein
VSSVLVLCVGFDAGIVVLWLNENVFCVVVLKLSLQNKGFFVCVFCFLCFLSHKLTF